MNKTTRMIRIREEAYSFIRREIRKSKPKKISADFLEELIELYKSHSLK